MRIRVAVRFAASSKCLCCHLLTTHEYTLANGLKLIVKEDHRSPVVISQIWYKAGKH